MTSVLDNATFFEDVRKTRSSVFDQTSTTRPNLSLGSTFGVGGNAWNGNASIWSPTSRQADGAVDENVVRDAPSHDQLYAPAGVGSRSLLSSSESEIRLARSGNPWTTSVRTNNTNGSRSQNQPISPLHLHNSNTVDVSHDHKQVGARKTGFEAGAKADRDIAKPLPPSQQTLTAAGRAFERPEFAEFTPSYDNSHGYQSANGATSESHSLSTRSVRHRSKPEFHNHRSVERWSLSQMSFEQIASSFSPELYSDPRSGAPDAFSIHQTHQFANGFNRGAASSYRLPQNDGWDNEAREANGDYQIASTLNQLNIAGSDFLSENNDLKVLPYPTMLGRRVDLQPNHQGASTKLQTGRVFDDGSHASARASTFEPFQDIGYQSVPAFSRNASFGEPGLSPSTTTGFRPGRHSPFYAVNVTPQIGSGSLRSATAHGVPSGTSNGQFGLYDRKFSTNDAFQRDPQPPDSSPTNLQYAVRHPPSLDYAGYPGSMRMNPLASPYTVQSYGNAPAAFQGGGYVSREPDAGQIIRSPLLEEFRLNSKTNKRYELKDIYNHVVEFSGDQHGSRFIQQKLETANSDEKDQIFAEIQPNSLQLMTDVFGNYVIQKLFEHGNQSQKKSLANQMKGHVLSLSTQMYACRVVQKALEHILTDQQASMVKELESHVLKCVKDQNGNHVIQKAIERVPAEHIQFIINAFTDQVHRLATHPYGCRVIQRMLEHCEEPSKQSILRELRACIPSLITDQFGNYVIQHVIENGDAEDRRRIVSIVQVQLLHFSKHKFASNVVEKSLQFAEEGQRQEMLAQLTAKHERGEGPVLGLMRDQYGNYVLQKVLAQLHGPEREDLINQIRMQLVPLKKFGCGKQIMAIEKLITEPHSPAGFAPTAPRHQMYQSRPVHEYVPSATARDHQPPSLSVSSESSAFPSTTASTADGPITPPHSANHQPSYPHAIQSALPLAPKQLRSQ